MPNFVVTIIDRLEAIFNPQSLSKFIAGWLMNLLVALAVMAFFYLVWLLARAALLTSLGIAGLSIGFAARDALSNLISGILIFIDRPFVLGDLVEIDGAYGKVERITLRSTRVVTSDGRMLAVPNTEIINKTVAPYTNFPHLRIDISVTVGLNENLESVHQVLLELVKDDPDFMTEAAPRVVVRALNDYNVAMELQAWIGNERRHVEKRFELREKVYNTLSREGVEMPFETLQLQPVDINLKDNEE